MKKVKLLCIIEGQTISMVCKKTEMIFYMKGIDVVTLVVMSTLQLANLLLGQWFYFVVHH
jgi:hypothetical protein